MDSNGRKLAVHGGAGAIGDFRVLVQEHSTPLNKALRVEGATSLENIAGQTEPTLKITGGIQNDGATQRYQAEVAILNNAPNALKLEGEQHFWRGGNLIGRIKPNPNFGELRGVFAINAGNGATSPLDNDVEIGQFESTHPQGGNTLWVRSKYVMLGGNNSAGGPSDNFPIALNGPAKLGGLYGIEDDAVALETDGLVATKGLKPRQNEIAIGKMNREEMDPRITINIGEGAGLPSGRGSQVNIRGDVTIQPGDGTNPGDLSVPRNVTLGGTLTANSIAFIQGPVSVTTTANVQGGLSVGTTQQPANAAVTGDLSVIGNVDLNGIVELPNRLKVTEDVVNATIDLICEADTSLNGKLVVGGETSLGSTLSVADDTAVGGKLAVDGDVTLSAKLDVTNATSLNALLTVNAPASFTERTHHLDGVAVTPLGASFSGMIKQSDRLEFYLDGTLRFYVDATGGHNA